MKTLIFSDTHLTNKPDPKRMALLKKIINEADQVIINGDFWEGMFISFDQFLTSSWQELFPLLKKKNTVYLYGNHDRKKRCDKRVDLFSNHQAESYLLQFGSKTLLITHGHNLDLSFAKIIKILKACRPLLRFLSNTDHFLIKVLGRRYLSFSRKKYNQEIRAEAKKILKKNQILVCGHTHLVQQNLNKGFINPGCFDFGLGQYLVVNGNNLSFHDVNY